MGGVGPHDEGGDDEGHEHAGDEGEPGGDAAAHEPDGADHEGAGGENLVAPGEVFPEPLEALGAEVAPPKQGGDDGDEGQAEAEARDKAALGHAGDFGEGEAQGTQGGVAAGDG